MRGYSIPILLLVLGLWTSAGTGGAGSSTPKKSEPATPDAAPPKTPPPADAAKSKTTPEAAASDKPKATPDAKAKPVVEATPKAPEPPKKEAPAAVVLEKLGEVKVSVGVVSSDTPSADAWKNLSKGQKLSAPLRLVEFHEKLSVKVTARKDLHQVFILLRNKATEEEVGYIAQRDGEGSNYKVDADLSGSGFEAGTYEILLYLGDFSLEDSMEWVLGDLNFKATEFTAGEKTISKGQSAPNSLYSISYDKKPEIKHMFRQPEPRPPRLVSDAFTLLVLSPILLLFILWIKIGVNMSNFPCTLSALVFHLGLTAIFGVYGLFWIKLTMFEALKWMTIPVLVTFVTGNRLLKHIAERRTK